MSKEANKSAEDTEGKVSTTAEVKNEAAGKTKEYFEEQGAKSKKQLSEGGKEVQISLTNTTMGRITKDFGKHLKAGHEQEFSDQAYAIYDKAGVIEKV